MSPETKKLLRKREPDRQKIKSLIESAKTTMRIVKSIPLDDTSAALIFRETYESIRQLGDAGWWIQGYETSSHDISMQSLTGLDIKEKLKLNRLDRFRRIRNDINYRGFKATITQANEILDFWDSCAKEIIKILDKSSTS
ncbi:hypothetical protein JW711_02295 [Candidatus Woesearchaeota archaeon]|nr:hypothetical protein [Candidatus Woesearchaeota archaeon]